MHLKELHLHAQNTPQAPTLKLLLFYVSWRPHTWGFLICICHKREIIIVPAPTGIQGRRRMEMFLQWVSNVLLGQIRSRHAEEVSVEEHLGWGTHLGTEARVGPQDQLSLLPLASASLWRGLGVGLPHLPWLITHHVLGPPAGDTASGDSGTSTTPRAGHLVPGLSKETLPPSHFQAWPPWSHSWGLNEVSNWGEQNSCWDCESVSETRSAPGDRVLDSRAMGGWRRRCRPPQPNRSPWLGFWLEVFITENVEKDAKGQKRLKSAPTVDMGALATCGALECLKCGLPTPTCAASGKSTPHFEVFVKKNPDYLMYSF